MISFGTLQLHLDTTMLGRARIFNAKVDKVQDAQFNVNFRHTMALLSVTSEVFGTYLQ